MNARRLLERVMYRVPSLVISEHDLDLVDNIKELLAQPEQPTREPLSDEDIHGAFMRSSVGSYKTCFINGVKWAEQYHGITGVADEH